ncbi:MAG: sugar phosphate nucleotidyltransferase [Bacteroidota bacterium]|nr:sugar phosphate nucleotidyltransferase [Bacteroidota bacterium]
MKPTLLILAAGMGSRYGGLKQLDAIGPNGEAIIDYSIYDAIEAGFGKVVFVIRKELEEAFVDRFGKLLDGRIEYEFAYQELDMLPKGYEVPEGRVKPWGTAHAVWCAKNMIDGPFVVINADDFYGKDAYKVVVDALKNQQDYFMVAYYIKNTLSKNGCVSRGVCLSDDKNYLVDVTERTNIQGKNGVVVFNENERETVLDAEVLVSMNFWGFQNNFFSWIEKQMASFLDEGLKKEKSEFYIPTVVNTLITTNQEKVKVLSSDAKWFGVTYKEDKAEVEESVKKLIADGEYPEKLWK